MYTTLISAAELKSNLSDDDLLVFDCRFSLADTAYGQRVYDEGHIPGASFLHLDDDLSSPITPQTGRHPLPDVDKLAERLQQCGLNADTQVVVYDDCSGAMAARAWWLLRWLGHASVAVLDGGFQAWTAVSDELEQAAPVAVAGNFAPDLQAEMNLSVAQLLAALDEETVTLVDARGAERYRGEQEPIDPVAGHIPGALNRPLTDNLVDGCFKPTEQLAAEWKAVLGDTPLDRVVHYCGSGVTACHNLLALEHAGLTGSRIYAGSWSEWIRDPARPVATN